MSLMPAAPPNVAASAAHLGHAANTMVSLAAPPDEMPPPSAPPSPNNSEDEDEGSHAKACMPLKVAVAMLRFNMVNDLGINKDNDLGNNDLEVLLLRCAPLKPFGNH